MDDQERHDAATADPMVALAALVLADGGAATRLGAIEDDDAFVAATLALAAAHGLAPAEQALRAAVRPLPPGMARFTPAPVTRDRPPPPGWRPARSVPGGDAPAFDWLWFGDDRVDDPFYEDTVRRLERRPFNRAFRTRTTLAALADDAGTLDAIEPAGFIHHLSRCGSTLAVRMLGVDPAHLGLSEPEPLDAVLRWAVEADAPADAQVAGLRAVVAALGRGAGGREAGGREAGGAPGRLFIKLESWHAQALPLLHAAFPATPWVFLHRDPVEVLVSQMRSPGIHVVAGMLPPSFLSRPGAEAMAPERYAALALARVAELIATHRAVGRGMLVGYDELPAAVPDRIAPHFGVPPDEAGCAAMLAAATRDAKSPDRPFASDGADKRRAATPAMLAAAREFLLDANGQPAIGG